jgi:hypothetical protein
MQNLRRTVSTPEIKLQPVAQEFQYNRCFYTTNYDSVPDTFAPVGRVNHSLRFSLRKTPVIQAQELVLFEHLIDTQKVTRQYFCKLLQAGLDAYHATIISQALARFMCEQVPPNAFQRNSFAFCKEAVVRSGLINDMQAGFFTGPA